jgi:hypothetical protein
MLFINYVVFRIERLLGKFINASTATQFGAGIVILTNFNALMTIDIILYRKLDIDIEKVLDFSFKGASIGIAVIFAIVHIMLLLYFNRPEAARNKYSIESKTAKIVRTCLLVLYLLINPGFICTAIYL